MALTTDTVIGRRPQVLHRQIRGEAVLLDPKSGAYFAVNEVGTVVWEALSEPSSVADLTAAVVAAFDVDNATARRDLESYLEELLRHGLVEIVEP